MFSILPLLSDRMKEVAQRVEPASLVGLNCLEANPADVESALKRYEAARIERGNRTKMKSLEMQKIFHSPELARRETAMPYIDKQWAPQVMRERYDWLLSYDATAVEI